MLDNQRIRIQFPAQTEIFPIQNISEQDIAHSTLLSAEVYTCTKRPRFVVDSSVSSLPFKFLMYEICMRQYCDSGKKENDILMDVHVFSLPAYENMNEQDSKGDPCEAWLWMF